MSVCFFKLPGMKSLQLLKIISVPPLSLPPPSSLLIPDSMIPSKADENSEGTQRGINKVENVTKDVNTED